MSAITKEKSIFLSLFISERQKARPTTMAPLPDSFAPQSEVDAYIDAYVVKEAGVDGEQAWQEYLDADREKFLQSNGPETD